MSDESLQRQVDELTATVARLAAQLSRVTGPFRRIFPVARKDADSNPLQWQERTIDTSGALADFTDGRVSDTAESFNIISDYGVEFLMAFEIGDSTRYLSMGGPLGLVPVDVSQDGGDGDTTRYTYTVTLLDGTQIGTGMSPVWQYEPNIQVDPGSHGTAYRNNTGAWVFFQVDEVPVDSDCPPP